MNVSNFVYLTHCKLNELFYTFILEDSNVSFRNVRLCDSDILREKWLKYLQTVKTLIRCSIFYESDQGPHCLPVTLLGVTRLQWDE